MVNETQALQYAISALGACIVAIGWWIASSLNDLKNGSDRFNEKMERVLIRLESHDSRLSNLEGHYR